MRRVLLTLGVLAGLLGVAGIVLVVGLRWANGGSPSFAIEHEIAIDASADEVWEVLTDFEAYPEWNPYVLALEGEATPGSVVKVTISQENWPQPITLEETIVSSEPPAFFHWHGSVLTEGLLETDHSFHIEPRSSKQVRFVQREEFRGPIARFLEEDARVFTLQAFQAMDEAIAERVAELRKRD